MIFNFESDQYSFSCYEIKLEITLKFRVFNTDPTNIAQIQNRKPATERASKTAQLTYRSCHATFRTQKHNWSQKAGLAGVGLSGGYWPKYNRVGFSCGKTRCNASVGVPTLTQTVVAGWDHS